MKLLTHLLILIFLSISALSGCSSEEEVMTVDKKGGDINVNSPEYAAIKFFEHIYNDDNINGALPYCSESLQRMITRYHTNRNVQRHVLNLPYDTVSMEVRGGESRFEQISGKRSTIVLYFSGLLHGKKIDEIRKVELSSRSGSWKIQRITEFPY